MIDTFPRAARRSDTIGLNILSAFQVLWVLTNELAECAVQSILCPLEPILGSRFQIRDEEAITKCRIHLIHLVFRRSIDSREDAGFRVDLHAGDLTIQNQLEGSLHHLGGGAVDLIQEDHVGSLNTLQKPARRTELGRLATTDHEAVIVVQHTDHVTVGHLRQPAFHHGKTEVICQLIHALALTDTVRATDHDRDVLGKCL